MSVYSKIYEEKVTELRRHFENENFRSYNFLNTIFTSMIIDSFSYKGDIPEFIIELPDYIEENFFGAGQQAYFEHNGAHYIAPAFPNGSLDKNGLYSNYTMIFRNGEQVIKKRDEICLGFNMSTGIPSIIIKDEIVKKCADALKAVDYSLIKAASPKIFFSNDENKIDTLTSAIVEAAKSFSPFKMVSGDWVKDDILGYDLFDNRAQDVLALWDIFVRYKNLGFTTFGINNVEISKNERLTASEGESNTEITRYGLFNNLYSHRVDWLDRINKKFGKKIELIVNRNAKTVAEILMTQEEKIEFNKYMLNPYTKEDNSDD